MKYINYKNIKIDDYYYFVDTDFSYPIIKLPQIRREKVYRKIDGEYSTKNDGDKYETIRGCAVKTEKEAIRKAIDELENYKRNRIKDIDNLVMLLKVKLKTPSVATEE